MPRLVDQAMAGDRPAKRTIRRLWAERAESASSSLIDSLTPLYLTLAGAEGRDLAAMADRGLLRRTATGAIATEDQGRFVAVENSPLAVAELQERYPGLKILEVSATDLVRSTSPIRWPVGNEIQLCRACIVNLDVNSSLEAEDDNGQLTFPTLQLVAKFAQLHTLSPVREWTLFLTLNATLNWTNLEWSAVLDFLRENCARDAQFQTDCCALVGAQLAGVLRDGVTIERDALTTKEQQALLMAFVPKKISHLVHSQGWRIETTHNLRYGGSQNEAPMVSWLIEFKWDTRASITPLAVYSESLRLIFLGTSDVSDDGSIGSLIASA